VDIRRNTIETGNKLSIRRQCVLLGIARNGLYYKPIGISDLDQDIMRIIDEQYTKAPIYGVEKMTAWLHREGVGIGHNKVRRLMRTMGLEAIFPKPRLSIPFSKHKIYPYLLNSIEIKRPNQVWSTDITYIRLAKGFVYLVAMEYENSKNPNIENLLKISDFLGHSVEYIAYDETIVARAVQLENRGLMGMDAIHISCAEKAKTDFFVTCDDKLIKKLDRIDDIKIVCRNLIDFVFREILRNE